MKNHTLVAEQRSRLWLFKKKKSCGVNVFSYKICTKLNYIALYFDLYLTQQNKTAFPFSSEFALNEQIDFFQEKKTKPKQLGGNC